MFHVKLKNRPKFSVKTNFHHSRNLSNEGHRKRKERRRKKLVITGLKFSRKSFHKKVEKRKFSLKKDINSKQEDTLKLLSKIYQSDFCITLDPWLFCVYSLYFNSWYFQISKSRIYLSKSYLQQQHQLQKWLHEKHVGKSIVSPLCTSKMKIMWQK